MGCALAVLVAGRADAAPTITEPVTLDQPAQALATGPDGALWVVGDDGLARVEPGGTAEPVAGLAADRKPVVVTAGPDDTIWYATDTGHVGRITAGGVVSEFGPLRGLPSAIAAGPDGNVWVSEQDTNIGESDDRAGTAARHETGALARITPEGTITEVPVGMIDPTDVAPGPDEAVWFVADETVGRVSATGEVTAFDTGLEPTALAAGAGRMWLTSDEDLATISAEGAVTPAGKAKEAEAIAAGPDGAMWLTMKNFIGRVTPDGTLTKHDQGYSKGEAGAAIVAGPDGAMWFAHSEPRLGRITVPPAVDGAKLDGMTVRAAVRANALATVVTITVRDASGAVVTQQDVGVPPGLESVEVAFTLTGLAPGGQYVATVSAASGAGPALATAEVSLSTPPAEPAPVAEETPTPEPEPEAAPAPTLAKTVVVRPNRGEVRYKMPGGTFTELVGSNTVPLGALVDTRRGEVRLETELASGGTQAGFFYGGLFRVRQARGGMTSLVLAGRLDCRARRSVATTSKKKRKKRKVWGRDSGGKFRTQGRDSVATVRGTRWLTQDTCRGTLTRVLDGAVRVRPRGKGKSVLVKAGGRHFVRHR